MMRRCRWCGSKITSHHDRWIHLEGDDDHTPEPPPNDSG